MWTVEHVVVPSNYTWKQKGQPMKETDSLFTKPQDSRTEDYITGRFG